jgi:hypothetical protein
MERNITIFITDGIDSEEYIFLKEIVLSFFYNKLSKMVGLVLLMVFYATFNKISVISWHSVLLVEEIGVPGQNH